MGFASLPGPGCAAGSGFTSRCAAGRNLKFASLSRFKFSAGFASLSPNRFTAGFAIRCAAAGFASRCAAGFATSPSRCAAGFALKLALASHCWCVTGYYFRVRVAS